MKKITGLLMSIMMVVGMLSGGVTAVIAEGDGNTPDNNAETQTYTITINSSGNGTVTASVDEATVTSAAKDATVTLTAEPAEGYQLETMSVVTVPAEEGAEGASVDLTGDGNARTFTMPESNVTVTASFTEQQPESNPSDGEGVIQNEGGSGDDSSLDEEGSGENVQNSLMLGSNPSTNDVTTNGYGLWVGGSSEVTSDGAISDTGGTGTASVISYEDRIELTLNNFVYSGSGHHDSQTTSASSDGVIYYTGSKPLVINLTGTNTLTYTGSENWNYAVAVDSTSRVPLTINGNGSLTATGGSTEHSHGIYVRLSTLTISNTAVTAKTSQNTENNCGIYASLGIEVTNSTLIASGSKAVSFSTASGSKELTIGANQSFVSGDSNTSATTVVGFPSTEQKKYADSPAKYIKIAPVSSEYVASITTAAGTSNYYTTLSDALTNWTDGSTLKLLADITNHSGTITVSDGTKTFDMNGFKLEVNADHAIEYSGTSNLTIKDSSSEKTGEIKTASTASGTIVVRGSENGIMSLESGNITHSSRGVYIDGSSTFNMNGGRINVDNAGVSAHGSAFFNLNGGTIERATTGSSYGRGLDIQNSVTVNITGGTVAGYTTGMDLSGFSNQTPKATMSGGEITGGSEAVVLNGLGASISFVMTGGIIKGTGDNSNSIRTYEYSGYSGSQFNVEIRGGKVKGRIDKGSTNPTILLKGGVYDNTAKESGNSYLTTGCKWIENTGSDAEEYPHAIAPTTTYPLWVGGTQVTSANATDVFGDGKVSFDPTTNTLNLNNAQVSAATENTPGIKSDDLNLTITGSGSISSNSSYGIHAKTSHGTLTLNGDFDITSAADHGIFAENSTLIIKDGNVTANGNADKYGQGIKTDYGVTIEGGTVNASGRQGIWISTGKLNISGGDVTTNGEAHGLYAGQGVNVAGGNLASTGRDGQAIYSHQPITFSDTHAIVNPVGGKVEVNTQVNPPEYYIVDTNGQFVKHAVIELKKEYTAVKKSLTWTKGSSAGATFQFKASKNDEDTINLFTAVQIDGKTVSSDNYNKTKGSVIIDFKSSYLETLPVGNHTVKATFIDGSADATLIVEKKSSGGSSAPSKKTDNVVTCQMAGYPANYAWNEAAKACQPGYLDAGGNFHPYNTARRSTPNTSDNGNLTMYAMAMFLMTFVAYLTAKKLTEDSRA